MVVWLIILAVLALRVPIQGGVGQSPRRTPLDDAEDVHDLYKEEGMKEITSSLVSQMSSACDVTHVIVRLILKEAEERSKLALRLQARLRKLSTKLASINAEPPPPVHIIAFSARVGNHQQNLRPLQVIVFKEIITLIGGGYSPSSGQFRCQVKGLYVFHVTVISAWNDRIETELVKNTKSQVQLYSGGNKHGSSTNTAVLSLDVSDLVWVRVFRNRGRFVHQWSSFSGHLVHAL